MYFSAFPTIVYDNTTVRDLSRSVSLPPSVRRIPTAFQPLEVTEGQREDLIAKFVYDREDFDWLVWLTNQVVDPYYGWYLTQEQFQSWMEDRYGSVDDAQQRILFWRNDWTADEFRMSVSTHDSTLTESTKRYYEPVYGQGAQVIGYERKKVDWVVSTNEIRKVTLTDPVSFDEGSLLTFTSGGERVGTAEVRWVSGSDVVVKDPLGETTGVVDDGTNTGVVDSWETVYLGIPQDERVYYSPVTAWDHHSEENEKNRQLLVLDPGYAGQAWTELRKMLNE
jgi:hypothetical protein